MQCSAQGRVGREQCGWGSHVPPWAAAWAGPGQLQGVGYTEQKHREQGDEHGCAEDADPAPVVVACRRVPAKPSPPWPPRRGPPVPAGHPSGLNLGSGPLSAMVTSPPGVRATAPVSSINPGHSVRRGQPRSQSRGQAVPGRSPIPGAQPGPGPGPHQTLQVPRGHPGASVSTAGHRPHPPGPTPTASTPSLPAYPPPQLPGMGAV